MLEHMFGVIDQKINSLMVEGKRPAVILINSKIYKSIQEEMIQKDMAQSFGKVRSPYDLRLYKGIQIISCDTVEAADVY